MPQRSLTKREREAFAADEKLSQYEADLKEAGGELGGEQEAKRQANLRIEKLKRSLAEEETFVRQCDRNIKGIQSRLEKLREMRRRRRVTVRRQLYREEVNPLRKELGMKPLKKTDR